MRPLLPSAGALVLALGWALPARALEPPKLTARVNDYAGLLSAADAAGLERDLTEYEQRTGHQFALLTVPSLEGDPIEDFSIRVAEAWKVGAKGRDDGLIFIVARDDHKTRIEVGYGLEGAVPDAIAKRVLEYDVKPRFRSGDFSGGIRAAFLDLMRAAEGEALGPSPPPRRVRSRNQMSPVGVIVLVLFFVALSWLLSRLRYTNRRWFGGYYGGYSGYYGGRGGSDDGGYSGGGGSDGGGFSGGGGDFGGGGASGDW